MTQKKDNDELMELLDSIDIYDEYKALEDKMEVFTREKMEREQKDAPVDEVKEPESEAETVNLGNTIVAPLNASTTTDVGGKTRVFSSKSPEQKKTGGETVVMSGEAIKTYMAEESTDEILKRQVMKEFNEQPIIGKEVKRILFTIVGVFVVLALIIGVGKNVDMNNIFFFFNSEKSDELTEEQKQNFEQIKSWAERYDQLSDKEKSQIVQLESKFNKLSDEQKAQINEILKQKTGFTFDELLAQEKSKGEDEKTNNNTELAEKKAEIKAQMAELEGELSAAEEAIKQANAAVDQAQADFDEANNLLVNSQADLDNALAELNNIERDELLSEEEKVEKYGSIGNYQKAYTQARRNYDEKRNTYDFNSMAVNVSNAQNALNQRYYEAQEAQNTYDYILQQYQELQQQLNELE